MDPNWREQMRGELKVAVIIGIIGLVLMIVLL
jgi:hypothetical protein